MADSTPRYSIFGSCVSRDVFGFSKESASVGAYIARSTIASAMSAVPDVSISIGDGVDHGLSPFEIRMVRSDIEKSWFQTVSDDVSSAIIIDLIDERFSVIEVGGSFVTESASLVRTSAYKDILNSKENIHTFLGRERIDRDCMPRFADRILSLGRRIILHKAFWATEFRSDEGLVRFEKYDYHKRMNDALSWRYDFLEKLLPGASVADPPDSIRIAEPAHRWGLAPFHYVDEYYSYVMSKL